MRNVISFVRWNGPAVIGLVAGIMLGGIHVLNAQTLFLPPLNPPQLLYNPMKPPIKIVTYNIASGASGMGPMPFYELCRDIMSQNPDVVVLQEVHDDWPGSRSPGITQSSLWKYLLHPNANCVVRPFVAGFPPPPSIYGYYRPGNVAYNFDGSIAGTAGVMILSKWPIVNTIEQRLLSTRTFLAAGHAAKSFGKDKGAAVINVNGRLIAVAAMHLDWQLSPPNLLDEYLTWLDQRSEPTVLAGDSNSPAPWFWFDSDPIAVSARNRYDMIPGAADPVLTDNNRNFDWILLRKQFGVHFTGGGVTAITHSDHPLAWASVLPEIENLALLPGAVASQSSTAPILCNWLLPTAARAIDGNLNGNWSGCSVTHTTGSDTNAWWQVDLGSRRYIDHVNIWNRTDCCAARLQDYDLLVSDSALGPWQDYHQPGIAGSPTSVPVSRSARYIRIRQRTQNFLHLAEVEVLGY